MIFEDFHIHSVFSDGKNTPEEIIKSAVEKGFKRIGFSDHSYTYFDESYCIKKDSISKYKSEISALKEKYADKIQIFCGIEQDYYSLESTDSFDYVIGSVHYIKVDDCFIPVDESPEILIHAAEKYFNADIYALVECYFDTVSDISDKLNPDIIGHFDLISKFNENNRLYDMNSERYLNSAKKAVDRLLKSNKPFEINTGAVSRGYRSTAYPSESIIKYIIDNGGKLILSSDSHCRDTLAFEFEKYYNIYKQNLTEINL